MEAGWRSEEGEMGEDGGRSGEGESKERLRSQETLLGSLVEPSLNQKGIVRVEERVNTSLGVCLILASREYPRDSQILGAVLEAAGALWGSRGTVWEPSWDILEHFGPSRGFLRPWRDTPNAC